MSKTLMETRRKFEEWWLGQNAYDDPVYRQHAEAGYVSGRLQGLEEAAKIADQWAESLSCGKHSDNPCCHVFTAVQITAAIREKLRGEGHGKR